MLTHSNITPGLGAELASEIQLNDLTDTEVNDLKQLGAERGIIVARAQVMTLDQQAAFAHRLGEPLTKPTNPAEIPPELIQIKAGQKITFETIFGQCKGGHRPKD